MKKISKKKQPEEMETDLKSKVKKAVGEQRKKEASPQKKSGLLSKLYGIRVKLILGFAIPIILIAAFGVISNNKAASAITQNYEAIAADALQAVRDNIFIGMDAVASKSYDLTNNENIKNYYNKVNKMSGEESEAAWKAVKSELSSAKSSHDYIYALHILGEQGSSISSVGELPADIFNSFEASEEGKLITSSVGRYVWLGSHSYLDEQLGNNQVNYITSVVRKMSENNGYIVIDIAKSQIVNSLSSINLGKGSIVGFVTEDGKEALVNSNITKDDKVEIKEMTEQNQLFSSLDFFTKTKEATENDGVSYEQYQGKKYLFLYSKVSSTGATICALVPQSTILEQVQQMKGLSLMFIALACIVSGLIGTYLATGIGNEIVRLVKSIARAAKGDLTTNFETKRKDEFKILSESLTEMVEGMRSLIEKVASVGETVNSSADTLSTTSNDILISTKDISVAIDEIEKGVVQQAEDTERCLLQMSNLSEKVDAVYENSHEIGEIAKNTKSIVGEGITTISELNDKSDATTEITNVIIKGIEELELQSQSIESFVEVINGISEQTNLLSLNASIEAARAGEAGRGFAVVAEEIRKLADQSLSAAKQINATVDTIKAKTKGTAASARQAESIVASQMEALTKTIHNFERINEHVEKLVENLDHISEGVKGIEATKDDTLDSISNISAVSQETATSSEEVSATANNQIASVENLSTSAMALAEEAKRLEEAIQLFKIN
jgi:methyl-accepting chemotaxis protein